MAVIWDFALTQTRDPLLWKAGFLLILANGIVTLLGVIRTPLITWVIPKEQVGMLGVVASWMPFLQLASLTGLDTASFHYVSKGTPWAFAVNIHYRLRWSLISVVGFLAGAGFWAWQGQISLAWLFIIAGLSYPLTAGLSAVSGTLAAQERYISLFWYRIWESLTDFTGFIPLLLSTWWINQIATFYGVNQLATALMQISYSLWLILPLYRSDSKRPEPHEEREIVGYGKHLTGVNSIAVINNRMDALLVGFFQPLNTMADYSIALLIYEQYRRLWNIYQSVRYPKLVRLPALRIKRHFALEGGFVFAGFCLMGILLVAAAFWLIPILLPTTYFPSLRYIPPLTIAFLSGLPAGMTDTYFRTQEDHKSQYLLKITGVIVGVIFSLLLLPRWGAYGVALARIVTTLAQSSVGIGLFLKSRPRVQKSEYSP